MGFLSDLFGGATKDAARANMAATNAFNKQGQKWINTGANEAQGYLEGAGGIYSDLADRSLGNLGYYSDALGLNGADGSAAALERFQTGPGYQFAMDQGLDSLDRRAAARGMLTSGNTNTGSITFAQGLANQEWGSWLDRLMGYDAQQNSNYLTGLSGQAGSLGSLADLAGQTTDRKLGLGSAVLGAQMGANNQLAQGRNQGVSAFGNILGGGLKLAGYL